MATNQGQSSTQDNEVKAPCYMPKPDNLAGNESGETTLIGAPIAVNLDATYGINGTASGENRSAKFKNVSQDIPDDARNQY